MSHCVLLNHLSRCTGRKASLSKYLACRYSRWSSNSSYLGKARERRRKEERATSTPERFEADDIDPYGHPRLPLRGYYEVDKCDTRREWVERFAGARLRQLGQWWDGEGEDDSRSTLQLKGNLENVIGLAKVPVGVAGPLLIHGEDVNGYELLPMATTEGALIASATRGATALTRSGGVWAVSQQQKISRAPVFYLRTGREATVLLDWLESNQTRLQSQIEEYSQHAKLLRLEGQQCGKMLTVQFVYTTGDAAGQNMTTSVTWHACRWALEQIKKELPHIEVEDFVIEGNRTGDKKAAHSHFLQTRGIAAQAETWIPESVLKSVLKLDSQTLLKAYHTFIAGGITAGVVSANINVSNVLAAVFTATGQDIASTIESSVSLFHMIPYKKRTRTLSEDFTPAAQAAVLDVMDREGGVYAALSLPSILAGTVGGGTGLATQKECLEIMNCYGKGKSRRLAEIIAAYALALDVSTIAAVGSGHFASAHERLGRNRPNTGLTNNHLNHHFFSKVLGDRGVLEDWKAVKVDTRNSILSEMTSTDLRTKKVGHLGYVLNYKRSGDNTSAELPVVVKSKPLDSEVYNLVNKMAQGCGLELASLFQKWKSLTGYKNCHEREIQLAMSEEEKLKKYMLEVYHVLRDPEKEVYAFAMELLTKEKFRHMSTENDVSVWTESDLKTVLSGMADIHSVYWSRESDLDSFQWLEVMSGERMVLLSLLWKALLKHAATEFPDMWTNDRVAFMSLAIDHIPDIWQVLEDFPQTLIHNDCNPRNICLRKDTSTSDPSENQRLCIYDWELATKSVPQRDIAEFLLFTCSPETSVEEMLTLLRYYKDQLELTTNQTFEWEKFVDVYDMATLEFVMNRLLQYTMAHTYKDYRFLQRVTDTFFKYIEQRKAQGGFKMFTD